MIQTATTATFGSTTSSHSIVRQRPLIIHTDAGFDDLVALQCLLHHTSAAAPTLITTVGGVLPVPAASATLRHLFPHANIASGRNAPAEPFQGKPLPTWLADYRTLSLEGFSQQILDKPLQLDLDLGINHHHNNHHDRDEALKHFMDFVSSSDSIPTDDGVDMICLGPLTNLAHWLEHCDDDDLFHRIHRIFVLGGNHPASESSAEFNFSLDPEAAHKVLHSPSLNGKLHLLTTTVGRMEQVQNAVGEEALDSFIRQKRNADNKCLLGNLLLFDEFGYSLSCDPVCAFALHHPTLVQWEEVAVQVEPNTGVLRSPD
ncbi:MAG: hypothetical protein SGARI_000711 [Bacillariaceae sp.]